MTTRTRRIDQLVGSLAPVKDRELGSAAEMPDAQALLTEILASPFDETGPRRAPRRIFAGASAAAAAAAIVVGVLVSTGSRETESAAAAILHRAAKAARALDKYPLQPGEYAYTKKSVNAYLTTSVQTNGTSYSVLVPHVREVWLGPSGGRLHETSGTPSFLSPRDREVWISAGRPTLAEGSTDMRLQADWHPLGLPTDADKLYARLKHDAAGHGSSLYGEMFVLVGDNLRESTLTPAQRAALYEVAARIPGVELVGRVKDSLGRSGVAVAMGNEVNTGRQILVFDPSSSNLLAEEDIALAGNRTGNPPVSYPPGTRVGYSTYVATGVVRSLQAAALGAPSAGSRASARRSR